MSILPEERQRLPESKRSKAELDEDSENGEWLTVPPELFPPGFSDDESDDDPPRKMV